ncbi:hypothetical protein [Neobacillus sp. D3-1R]
MPLWSFILMISGGLIGIGVIKYHPTVILGVFLPRKFHLFLSN